MHSVECYAAFMEMLGIANSIYDPFTHFYLKEHALKAGAPDGEMIDPYHAGRYSRMGGSFTGW
jgi:hypothetical protein